MNLKTGLATALVAAVVAAIVSAATVLTVWRDGVATTGLQDGAPGKAVIEEVVEEYLKKNPEILVAMTTELDRRQQEEQEQQQAKAISENADALFRSENSFAAGNPDGDVTVVEFFDYNCGFCKRGLSQLSKLIDNDKKVRVVLKELPILSQGSEEASRIALAAKKQGKYWEVHSALLNHRGALDGNSAMRVAGKLGLDVEKLNKDKDSKEVTAEIEKVREIAQKMGINGTPHFLVGDRTIPGAPENLYEQLAGHVKDLRENGCEVC